MDSTFSARMRQGKVVQWGLAYLAFAWMLVQVFDLVAAQYDQALEALDRVVREGPDLGDFENVGWVHLEAQSLLAGLARRAGDAQRA